MPTITTLIFPCPCCFSLPGIGAHVHKPSVRGDDVLWVCGGHRTHQSQQYYDSAGQQPINPGEVAVCKVDNINGKGKHTVDTDTTGGEPTYSSSNNKPTSFPALAKVLKKLDDFMYKAFEGAGLIERSDCMLARYCGSKEARFQKHVDNTQEDGRKLSVVVGECG